MVKERLTYQPTNQYKGKKVKGKEAMPILASNLISLPTLLYQPHDHKPMLITRSLATPGPGGQWGRMFLDLGFFAFFYPLCL